jgi:Bacterial Ig-like domain (group 3)/HYR domain
MHRVGSALLRFGTTGLLVAGALVGSSTSAVAAGPIESARFELTGHPEFWTPPAGVGQIRVTGAGGSGATSDGHRGHGGAGAVIQQIADVLPTTTIRVNVGGQGGLGSVRTGGYNGGGKGGLQGGDPATSPGNDGGGGGGATEVDRLATPTDFYGDIVVIAGGGGGGGGNQLGIGSGGDGGAADVDGVVEPGGQGTANLACFPRPRGWGGEAGKAGEGGTGSMGIDCGGTYGPNHGGDGGSSRLSATWGGHGADSECCVGGGGGGGGGGYGGGGGGGAPATFGGGGDGGGAGGSIGGTDLKQQHFGDGYALIEWVVGAPISMTMTASPVTAVYGQPVTFTAKLNPVPDAGIVQFSVDGQNAGSPVGVDTSTGTATSAPVSTLGVGQHTVTAYYGGTTDFDAGTGFATSTVTHSITVNPDTDPPAVTVNVPAPPAGQNGYFNISDLANAGGSIAVGVSGSDTSGTVTALACTDNGAVLAVTAESGSNPRTGTAAVSANGTHAISCTGTDSNGNSGSTGGHNTAAVNLDTTTPTLTVPASPYPVDATGPTGAVVTAYPVSASDTDPGDTPSITCGPATPYRFAIGDTSVTCFATDQAGNAASTRTFTLHVKGAAEQLTDLAGAVEGVEPGGSLSVKVRAAELSLSRGQTTAACGHLAAFMNEVGAQSGKKIPVAQADQLIAAAARIRTVIGCP